ncbi:MAG TPA: GNAT family N-acetyltransferase [Bacteroidales bacterium]|nr:GNAT family N-acetyltransferase [Bacteroidales bacterium]
MMEHHWDDVLRIYHTGLASGHATFETHAPDWNTWNREHLVECRLVAKADSHITGWAALSRVSERRIYAGVAEVSIYVDPDYQGLGIGNKLMKALIEASEAKGIWTLQAYIFPRNERSLRLHHKNGFRIVGTREKIGKMDNSWHDVILVERRSRIVGTE